MAVESLADKIIELTQEHQQKTLAEGFRDAERRNFGRTWGGQCRPDTKLMSLVPLKFKRFVSEHEMRVAECEGRFVNVPLRSEGGLTMQMGRCHFPGSLEDNEQPGIVYRFVADDGKKIAPDLWVTEHAEGVFVAMSWGQLRMGKGAKLIHDLDLSEDVEWGKIKAGSVEEQVLHEMGFDRPELGSTKVEKYLAGKLV
jgi:hypothetical protein